MEIEKDGLFFAGRHVPDDHSLAVGGVEYHLFRFWQTTRLWGRAPALRKVLKRALRNIKQGDGPAVSSDRCYNPFHHHLICTNDPVIDATNLSTSMTEPDLIPFVNAQAQVYSRVVEELTDGRKRTHWIWFIFPQLVGLGRSATAQRYAIRDLEHARRYLADPILGGRLRDDVRRMIGHKDRSAPEILGSPDDLKFRSCLTLFRQAASEASDQMLFTEALDQFYDGKPDPRTLELLGSQVSRG
jgi:uncharacterized protein (DUF1810 family)